MNKEQLEILRKKARNIYLYRYLLTLIICIILGLYTKSIFPAFIALIIGLVLTTLFASKPTSTFVKAYKELFVLKSLQSIFTDLVYEPEKGIDESVIRDTKMLYMGDSFDSNDYISGKYKDINVVASDIHIQEREERKDSEGNTETYWVTIFLGRWMIFDFNKTFKANIEICEKGFQNATISNWGQKTKYKKVSMEDEEFNKRFKVYAQNEHEAFYIITPSLMEKLKTISNKTNGNLLFCFVDNKLHVGLANNKDSFEHSIFTKIDEEKIIKEVTNEIKIITDFVDDLNLDNDLFKTEV